MTFGKPLLLGLLATTAQAPLHAQAAPPATADTAVTATGADQAAAAAEAQPGAPAAAEEEEPGAEEGEEIIVTGQRQRGAVLGDIPPEIQLNSRDIRALGAGSIAELLQALAPQTQSGRGRGDGRPVVLLNGKRISGFQEIRNIPPEAIQRVDILPEEVALKYGYRADQRVVNFVLRPRFRALTSELEYGLATDGGRSNYAADFNLLRIDRAGRWELDAEYRHSSPLLESERDLGTQFGEFRTLLPETDQLQLGGTLNRTILGNVSATANATFTANDSQSRFGLAPGTTSRPLFRESESRDGHLGVALNGDIRPWRWSFTANYDRSHNITHTDRRDVLDLRDRAETNSQVANAQLVLNGSLFRMSAGDVSTTFRTGIERQDLESESSRSGVQSQSDLGRTRGEAQLNIDVPIASRRNDVLASLGDLSANFNAEVEHYSDFGTLRTLGGGLNWSPIAALSFIASVTDEEGAPSVQQLGNPVLATPNVRVFDFTRGETVDVTRIEGGNPSLLADNRRVFKLGMTARPLAERDLSFTANYTNTRTRDAISSFPAITAEIEAAFPERFERDAQGRLFRFDGRPVNFERTNREEMRWGINFSKPIASAPPPRGAFPQRFRQFGGQGRGRGDAPAPAGDAGQTAPAPGAGQATPLPGTSPATPPPEAAAGATRQGQGERGQGRAGGPGGGFGGGFGGPGGGFGGRGGFGGGRGGRLQFGLFHTWRFEDKILIREGVPELDLLDGSAFGSRGGRSRHEVEAQAGIFKNGFGARLTGNWQSATRVNGRVTGPAGERSDLFFSDVATVNLRLFANLGEQAIVTRNPWLRGTRLALSVNNIFNTRPNVTDSNGLTPLGYQPDNLDPLGRSMTFSIRKLLF